MYSYKINYRTILGDLHTPVSTYLKLRDAFSQRQFGKTYNELEEEQQKLVQKVYPQKISEAEPKNYGSK